MDFGIKNVTYQLIDVTTGITVMDTGIINFNNNFKEENNMEENLNKYLKENAIEVDENGNFEMYIVVDADDKDHVIGSIFHGKETEVYSEKRAYEDLKADNNKSLFNVYYSPTFVSLYPFNSSFVEVKKKTTIEEDLMMLKDKMFKILVNKENVIKIVKDVVYVNKYKVIDNVKLNPELKFKILSILKDNINVVLYNSLTEKSKIIDINTNFSIDSLKSVKSLIYNYLKEDDNRVALMNSIIENGEVL